MPSLATKIDTDALLKALQWRYATKKFDPAKKIPEPEWNAVEKALVLTPSSYGLQPWKFLVVQDPTVREKLFAQSWRQRQVLDCSHFVVLAILKNLGEPDIERFIKRTAEVRGMDCGALAGFQKVMVSDLVKGPRHESINNWAANQTYIALGNLLTFAAMAGIDACPMEGIVPAGYDEVLNLEPTGYATAVACALGYRAADDKYAATPKVRFKQDEVIRRI